MEQQELENKAKESFENALVKVRHHAEAIIAELLRVSVPSAKIKVDTYRIILDGLEHDHEVEFRITPEGIFRGIVVPGRIKQPVKP